MAYRLGDDTARLSGRLSFSPMAHLDPVGSLMFIVSSLTGVGFGWAKPVPVNPLRLRHMRRDDILVSLAGVTVNLIQAGVWAGLARAIVAFAPPTPVAVAAASFCAVGVEINLILFLFNLLPIPPLDGWHVLTQSLRIAYTTRVLRFQQMGPMLLFMLLFLRVLNPFFQVTLWPLYDLLVPPGVPVF